MLRALVGSALSLTAVAASGCYCSHEREDEVDAAVVTDTALAIDVPLAIDTSREPDAWTRPCEWDVVAPWQLTDGPGDQGLHDITVLDEDFAVVTGSQNDPPPEVGRFVHRVSLRERVGERQQLFGAPAGAFFVSVGLARGRDRILASTWDDGGCRARAMSLGGTVMGEPITLPIARCVGVTATDTGFAIFERPTDVAPSLHVLSDDGTRVLTTSEPIAMLADAFWWSRVRLVDGTYVVAGMHDGVSPTSGSVQRLDASGLPVAEPVAMPAFAAASRVRLTQSSGAVLAAWLEQRDGDADSQERVLRVVPLDGEGRASGPVETPSGGIAYRDGGLSSAAIAGGVLFAFVEISPGDRFGQHTSVVVARTDLRGERQEELRIGMGAFQRSPVIRARGDDAIVGFTASTGGVPTQVFVGGLECR